MSGNVIIIPSYGSPYFQNPVSSLAAFPSSDASYTVRLAEDTGILYYWNGVAWAPIVASPILASFSATLPLLYNNATGVFSIVLADATHNGYLSSTDWNTFNNKQSALTFGNLTDVGTDGITIGSGTGAVIGSGTTISQHVADVSHNGYLSSADWSTFNSKEPAITSGTTSQYWRGDKTFQNLVISALTAIVNGVAPAISTINEVLTASQALTTTNVGSSGTYGAVVSKSLTAGRWRVFGVCQFNENGADLTTGLQCGISASSTGSGLADFDTSLANGLISSTSDLILLTPPIYVYIASPTTYYLNSKFTYTSGTPKHGGKITAERIG